MLQVTLLSKTEQVPQHCNIREIYGGDILDLSAREEFLSFLSWNGKNTINNFLVLVISPAGLLFTF